MPVEIACIISPAGLGIRFDQSAFTHIGCWMAKLLKSYTARTSRGKFHITTASLQTIFYNTILTSYNYKPADSEAM